MRFSAGRGRAPGSTKAVAVAQQYGIAIYSDQVGGWARPWLPAALPDRARWTLPRPPPPAQMSTWRAPVTSPPAQARRWTSGWPGRGRGGAVSTPLAQRRRRMRDPRACTHPLPPPPLAAPTGTPPSAPPPSASHPWASMTSPRWPCRRTSWCWRACRAPPSPSTACPRWPSGASAARAASPTPWPPSPSRSRCSASSGAPAPRRTRCRPTWRCWARASCSTAAWRAGTRPCRRTSTRPAGRPTAACMPSARAAP